MKILLLTCFFKTKSGNSFGGAEKSITKLANWFAENTDSEVALVSVQGNEKPYTVSELVNYYGHEISDTGKLGIHKAIYNNVVATIKKELPDIIITFDIHPLFYTVVSGLHKGRKLIFSERNDPKIHYGRLQRIMRSIVINCCSGVVFQTKDAMDYFGKSVAKKGIVIHNPVYIDYNQYPINIKDSNRIVAVGRLSHQKNYPLLIEAFDKVHEKRPELILDIYGEGEEREFLQELINNKGLTDAVTLHGTCSDVIERIYGARMFVMTSFYEGMPNALMEAMSLGIPAVCSDCPCGGPRELIIDGENGFLFENNNIVSLVDAMERCLNADACEIALREKEICNTHNSNIIFNKWFEFVAGKTGCNMHIISNLQGGGKRRIDSIKNFVRDILDWLKKPLRRKDLAIIENYINQKNRSILSMNCFAGHIYQDLKWTYTTPTAGLFFFADDFVSLIEDINRLKLPVVEKNESKWKEAYEIMKAHGHVYPIGEIEGTGIEIHFLHYKTFEDAMRKWNRRVARFNFDNYIAIGFWQNNCTSSTIERFSKIKKANKVWFTNKEFPYKDVLYIKEFKDFDASPDPYKYVGVYYKYLSNWIKQLQSHV